MPDRFAAAAPSTVDISKKDAKAEHPAHEPNNAGGTHERLGENGSLRPSGPVAPARLRAGCDGKNEARRALLTRYEHLLSAYNNGKR